jgi:hypothetical protein
MPGFPPACLRTPLIASSFSFNELIPVSPSKLLLRGDLLPLLVTFKATTGYPRLLVHTTILNLSLFASDP